MRQAFIAFFTLFFIQANGQADRDTTWSQCPVFITDTVSSNNFFMAARPAVVKVYRVKGKLTIRVEQKDQFFTLYFHDKKLKNTTYTIQPGSRGKSEVEAAYSFRSGDQSSFISVSRGKVETFFDEAKQQWQLRVSGLIINQVERSATHYRVKAEFWLG
jgi:hypothetical protein